MQFASINQRAEYIKDNQEEINRFVEEYKPFIASCVEKVTGRYVRYGEDDELSIALIAFVEAIKTYQGTKGSFLSFSQNVIKRRLIDYYRKEKKYQNIISINEYYGENESDEMDLTISQSIQAFSEDEISEYRRLELEDLKRELSEWDISFFELVQCSPKHDKSRKTCAEIVRFLVSRPGLIKIIKDKRYLPVSDIENGLKIPRKKIERARKYIIAVIIIKTGDYQYIKDYVNIFNY